MNEGKRFEQNIRRSIPSIIRLYDSTNGYSGVCNPCDFIYYRYPYMFMIEAKSVKEKKLYWTAITENQHQQLEYYDTIFGVNSIILIEFRAEQEIYALPYKVLKQLRERGEKGISVARCKELYEVPLIPAEYKRVNFEIDLDEFNQILERIGNSI